MRLLPESGAGVFGLELGEDDAGDDDDDAEDFEPAEGLLADEDGGDE